MAIKTLRVFQEFTSEGYIPMPVDGNIDYGYTIAGTFPATTPSTFQTDDPDLDVTLTETTDYYVWIRSHGTAWNPMYTRNVRVYPDSPAINNVVMGIIIARLDDAVPYTGATDNVDLGEFGLRSGYLELDLTPTATPTTEGVMSWDDGNGTANLTLKGGEVNLAIGQELVARVYNDTGGALTDGQIVYINGAQGNRVSVDLASNTTEVGSSVTFGMVTESIAIGAEGFVTVQGTVNHLNTSGLTEGQALYLGSTPGTYTNIKPSAPNHAVLIGYVERVHATVGSIYVKVQNGYELNELHNVSINSITNNQALIYDFANSIWENRTIVGTNGYIPYSDSTDLFKDSPIYTNGTNVAIGGTSFIGSNIFTVYGKGIFTDNLTIKSSGAYGGVIVGNTGTTGGGYISFYQNGIQKSAIGVSGAIESNTTSNLALFADNASSIDFYTNGSPSLKMSLLTSGRLILGYSVDQGTLLAVNGTALFGSSVTASSFIVTSGLSTQFLKANGSLDSTAYISLTSLSVSSPLSYNNTTGAFTISQATTSTNGFLSSTDWNTFNGKQNALGYTPVPTTRTLTINGTSYDLSADRTWTISGVLSGLSSGYIPYATGSNSLTNSNIYFNGTNVGINTTSILATLHVKGTGAYGGLVVDNTGTTGGGYISIYKNGSQIGIFGVSGAVYGDTSSNMALFTETGSSMLFMTNGSTTPKLTIATTGLATFTSTVVASNGTLAGGSGASGQLSYWNGTNSVTGVNNLFWNNSTNTLGIGTASPLLDTSRQGLVIRGGSLGAEFVLQSTSSTDGAYDGFSMAMDGNQAYLYNKRNGTIRFGANNALKAELYTNGDFNITGSYLINGVALTTGISGSGSSGQIGYWSGTSAMSGTSNLFWNNTDKRMGLGTASPTLFTGRQGMVIRGAGAELVLQSTNSTDGTYDGLSLTMDGDTAYIFNKRNGTLQLGANNAKKAELFANGDFSIEGSYFLPGNYRLAVMQSTTIAIAYAQQSELALYGGSLGYDKMISVTTDVKIADGKNFSFGSSPSYGGGLGVVYIANRNSVPTSTPSNGGIMYVESGALKYRGSAGTVTTIANA